MAIFNSFTFDGENSLDYGVYITGEAVYNAPERAVDMVSIPGKNGALAIDQGRYENIDVTYPAGAFGTNQAEFAQRMAAIRSFLASRHSYKRLEDTYNPDEFRLGLYKAGLETTPVGYSSAGEFDITFDCKPQRFLKSGETPVDYTAGQSPSDEQTKTGSIVTFEAEEDTIISDVKADINPVQDLHGYDKPWAGGNGKNIISYPYYHSSGRVNRGITFTVSSDGVITANGTGAASSQPFFSCTEGARFLSSGTEYIMSQDTTSNKSFVIVYFENSGGTLINIPYSVTYDDGTTASRTGSSVSLLHQTNLYEWCKFSFTSEEDVYVQVDVRFIADAGTITNAIVKPMIRLASVSDDSYEPYSNICPISGWDEVKVTRTGKNLVPYPYYSGSTTISDIQFTMLPNGFVHVTGTASGTRVYYVKATSQTLELEKGDYVLSGCPEGGSSTKYKLDIASNYQPFVTDYGEGAEFTYNGEALLQIRIVIYSGQTVDLLFKPSINRASEYQAFTIDLNGTRYGGTLDVTSGVLTVDRAEVDLGTLTWTKLSTVTDKYRFRAPISSAKLPPSSSISANILCSVYPTVPADNTWDGITGIALHQTEQFIFVCDMNYAVATAFKTAMNGVQLVYELATPLTVQLTPTEVSTLLGTNNMWADSGDITVKYGTNPYFIINPTDFASKPLLEVTGVGTFWLGDTQFTITGTSGQIIYIDCETGECYKKNGEIISPANGLVTLNRLDFPELASGINNIQLGSGISKVKITPRWWRL